MSERPEDQQKPGENQPVRKQPADGPDISSEPDLQGILEALRKGDATDENMAMLAFGAQSFSGPLPPPAMLDGYERIQVGLGERISAYGREGRGPSTPDRRRKAGRNG